MAKAGGTIKWQTLTRADLRSFDKDATEVVLTAMRRGGTGRLSSNGHVILRNKAGQTMAVSADSTKSREVQRINLRKLFPDPELTSAVEPTASSGGAVAHGPSSLPVVELDGPLTPCPAKGCDAEFATEGARYAHVRDNHAPCQEDGCPYVGRDGSGLAGHTNLVHRGYKPWKSRRAAAPKASANGSDRPQSSAAAPSDADVLAAIRQALGPDPRVAELEG